MSFVQVVVDGAAEAARLLPLAFALATVPAGAQIPRAVPAVAAPVEDATAGTATLEPLTPARLLLVARQVEVRIDGTQARLVERLTWRNDEAAPISARYTLPASARILQLGVDAAEEAAVATALEEESCGDAADEPTPEAALLIEAGEGDPAAQQTGVVWLAPGDEVTVQVARPGTVLSRHGRHRLVLPLLPEPERAFVPRFSAEVTVRGEHGIRALASPTHGGIVSGVGAPVAFLSVPNGRVYEAQHFALEFEFGVPDVAPSFAGGWEGRANLTAVRHVAD
ncbi:MAG TPA: hypothetical protein VFR86_01960 [Burkholderiaceae bacterium]|nr:hypothetical protein [Burkholderiaceae bacterium]